MKKTQKWIFGSLLAIVIVVSGGLATWFFFFQQPPEEELGYPDVVISDYSLDGDNLTITITNIGNAYVQGIGIIVAVSLPTVILYYGQTTLDVDEDFIFTINLTDFKEHFISGTTYLIEVQLDCDEDINQDNNYQAIHYYYEGEVSQWLPSPNTYSFNSTVEYLDYAVKFNATQIVLENSINISNGSINGYDLYNSTILENTTITDSSYVINIALHEEQNLTLRNIWDSHLNIILNDDSQISLINSIIQNVQVAGSNNLFLSNSSIYFLTTTLNFTISSSLIITNNSHIEMSIISRPMILDFNNSSLKNFNLIVGSNPYFPKEEVLISGNIRNCSIYNILSFGQVDLNIFMSDIFQVNMIGTTKLNFVECTIKEEYVQMNARSILNNTKITGELCYGIIVYSDEVNITNGVIEGMSYVNNTVFINANVSKRSLDHIVVNGTASIYISNYSCNLFLFDQANVIVNESSIISPNDYGVILLGSSKLTGINASFDIIMTQEDSSVELYDECQVDELFANSSKDVIISNCILENFGWYSTTQGSYVSRIVNSTIETFIVPQSSRLDVINCSIDIIYEGIKFESGKGYFNSSGFFGGVSSNNLNISNSIIYNRTIKYVDIEGDALVMINDIHDFLNIVVENGNLIVNNCTMDSLQLRNDALASVINCSTKEFGIYGSLLMSILGPQAFVCTGNSQIYLNDTYIREGYILMLLGNSNATIEYSHIFGLYVYQQSSAIIHHSDFWIISIASFSLESYALSLFHCSVESLSTIGWKY